MKAGRRLNTMQYFGGKSRIAKQLVAVMAPTLAGRYVWEPFCGGLNMTPHLARASLGVFASDANPALIALYSAVRAGWDPPSTLSREEWQAAKALPHSNPMHGFCGLCSFGGKWFAGMTTPRPGSEKPYERTRRQIIDCVSHALTITVVDFVASEVAPPSYPLALYCDPPYINTQGVTAYEPSKRTGKPFDHSAFWTRAEQWSRICPVFVSEYVAPDGWSVVAEIVQEAGQRHDSVKTERLFYRGPDCY